jgi:HTH-type transcriptional regulator/antitoxin HigA
MSQASFDPDYRVAPGETLLELMDERGWSMEHVAHMLHTTPEWLQELLQGVHPITEMIAGSLHQLTDVPAGFWMRLEANYREPIAHQGN